MMNRIYAFFVTLFFSSSLLACPYCVGSTQAGKDDNTTLILAIFIVAIYIPYIVIYRLIKKQRALAAMMSGEHDSTGSANS